MEEARTIQGYETRRSPSHPLIITIPRQQLVLERRTHRTKEQEQLQLQLMDLSKGRRGSYIEAEAEAEAEAETEADAQASLTN